jgi:hypothetical protein
MKKLFLLVLTAAALFSVVVPPVPVQANGIRLQPVSTSSLVRTGRFNKHVQRNTGTNLAPFTSSVRITGNIVGFRPVSPTSGMASYNLGIRIVNSNGTVILADHFMHLSISGMTTIILPFEVVNSNNSLQIAVSSNTAPVSGGSMILEVFQ